MAMDPHLEVSCHSELAAPERPHTVGNVGSSDPGLASVTRHEERRKERVLLYLGV